MDSKRCYKCKETKALSEFYRDKHTASGLTSKCKGCAKAQANTWNAANPTARRVNTLLNNAVQRGAEKRSQAFGLDPAAILEEQEGWCYLCPTNVVDEGLPYEIDHLTPLSRGGEHHRGNLAAVCRTCNKAKGNKTEDEFDAARGLET